jgi:pilin isopeptide linkage protein
MAVKKTVCAVLLLSFLFSVLFAVPVSAEETAAVLFIPVESTFTGMRPGKVPAFRYTISEGCSSTPMPPTSQLTIQGGGRASFGPIFYQHTGSYVYQIQQEQGTLTHCQYDDSVYTVTVQVTRTDSGRLSAAFHAKRNGKQTETVSFVDSLTEPVEFAASRIPLTVSTSAVSRPAASGGSVSAKPCIPVAGASVAGLVVLRAVRKKTR